MGRSRAGVHGLDSSMVCIIKANEVTGEKSVEGGPRLKETQAYTDEFGIAVLRAYTALGAGDPVEDSEPAMEEPYQFPEDVWALADLPSVLRAACHAGS